MEKNRFIKATTTTESFNSIYKPLLVVSELPIASHLLL